MKRQLREDSLNNAKWKIWAELHKLPPGSIKERIISGRKYYYHQRREGKKVVHTYIGKELSREVRSQMLKHRALHAKLKKLHKQTALLVNENK